MVALQTKQIPVSRRHHQTHSLSPAGRSCKTPSPSAFFTAASMPSIYIACAAPGNRRGSSPSGSRHQPSVALASGLLKPPRSSPPAVARQPVTNRTTGTCRGAGRPSTAGLTERTKTYSSVKTAVMADNQTALSRIPMSSGLHKAIADEVSQQVNATLQTLLSFLLFGCVEIRLGGICHT